MELFSDILKWVSNGFLVYITYNFVDHVYKSKNSKDRK